MWVWRGRGVSLGLEDSASHCMRLGPHSPTRSAAHLSSSFTHCEYTFTVCFFYIHMTNVECHVFLYVCVQCTCTCVHIHVHVGTCTCMVAQFRSLSLSPCEGPHLPAHRVWFSSVSTWLPHSWTSLSASWREL